MTAAPTVVTITPPAPAPDSAERLLLWTIENELTVHGTTGRQHLLGGRLRRYLVETCEHAWEYFDTPDEQWPTHRQCSKCQDLDLIGEAES